ncbi:leucyl aminopeptidase [Sphingomonas vulcanisoli]|uniref:Probable cytosol aminopeptidase n=1 Tax=Sphingomonas vulcanisoli TaxID=1658060 RepID=A0ABX0TQP6_9SPHN|nr:leucyl aminopeptidase [Sphingomonas vulcanisoli]NIJ07049.1 leucyl aminopeptidase [Sphingomonas vulcanisoli]
MLTIRFAVDRPQAAPVVVLPVLSGEGAGRALPASLKGGEAVVAAAIASARFTGEAGSLVELHLPEGAGVTHLLIVGVGAARDGLKAGGAIVARLLTSGAAGAVVDLSHIATADRAALAAGIAEAASLRSWRLDTYRTKLTDKQKPSLTELTIVAGDRIEEAKAAWKSREAVVEGAAFTRMLVTEPANLLYPQSFVELAMSGRELGLEIEVLGEREMRLAGMGALLGVAQGSEREAQLLVMKWDGTNGAVKEPTAFVGKGVTFDTGGISLKPGPGMEDMKWDMGGAGAVTGVMRALAARKAPVHVVGICGLVENMPDGKAQRPGDVVTTMSGQTVEVLNTDAEGRLVLCDALTWVQKRFAPKTIVDLATLTGAMIVSLGHEYGGIFSNDDTLAEQLTAAGKTAGEKLWRMPMGDAYDKMLESPIADMKNIGPREAGSITAAQFIKRFIDDGVKWAHLDIAGMVWAAKPAALYDKGATGYGVRLLDQWVRDVLEG